MPVEGRSASRPARFLAVGFVGLAIAIASIADRFSARPYDGIVPLPYGQEGIEVRMVLPGSPAEKAGIPRERHRGGRGRPYAASVLDLHETCGHRSLVPAIGQRREAGERVNWQTGE